MGSARGEMSCALLCLKVLHLLQLLIVVVSVAGLYWNPHLSAELIRREKVLLK